MGTQQAHMLITCSLEKIASSRRKRSEMSLHKNLLVTTVIQRARLVIIEEDQHYYLEQPSSIRSPSIDDNTAASDPNVVAPECYAQTETEMREIEVLNKQQDYTIVQELVDNVSGYLTALEDDDSRMDWVESPTTYEPTGEENKENSSPAVLQLDYSLDDNEYCVMKRPRTDDVYDYYPSKRLKMWDPNDMMCNIDQDDSTSHTLRLVSVLSATLSKPTNTSYSWSSTPNEMCRKQAKDSVNVALLLNRPAMAIAV